MISLSRPVRRGAPILALLAFLPCLHSTPAAWAADADSLDTDAELNRRLEILTAEVTRLREQVSIPETDAELQGMYGMGPAASKVYRVTQGISFGGYGEFYFAAPVTDADATGAVNRADFLRMIGYVGYKFSNRVIMNAEIEYEHATTSANYQGKAGSVSVEFAYLDFLLDPAFNLRTGNILVPIGLVNLMHEPTTFLGNFRPVTETSIIPTTWRELGIGAHGGLGDLAYSAFVVNGLNAAKFDDKGVREGRQKGNQVIWEDVGGVVALDYAPSLGAGALMIGASAYVGGADQGLVVDSTGTRVEVDHRILEAHADFRTRGLSARVLVAASEIDNAEALSRALYTNDADVLTRQVPGSQSGWYAELGYDVAPLLRSGASFTLKPWVRYERYHLQRTVAAGTGIPADPSLDASLLTLGVESRPHENVVLKMDFVFPSDESGQRLSDEIRVGAGFIY